MVRNGVALPQALDAVFAGIDASSARGAIQDIAYRTMRCLGLADALMTQLTSKPPTPASLHALLSCALTLLVQQQEKQEGRTGYDSFTVVNQAVNAAAADRTTAPAKGMVNAVLRRFLREADALLKWARTEPQAAWNYPSWWIDDMRAAHPQNWEAILTAGNQPPPLTLRVNRRKLTPEAWIESLTLAGIGARRIGPDAVRLDKPMPVAAIPGFSDGIVSVQDAAAQLAAPLLDVSCGMRVLDACAAPGGKTGHLLERADIEIIALDHDPKRLARVEDNLRRLRLTARLVIGDAASPLEPAAGGWWDGRQFDRILADVPCTASGIVRRHPDIRWLRRPQDTAKLAALSAQILDNLWQMLRPDGKLLLVTCSLWPAESHMQADAFAHRQDDAERLAAPGQLLPAGDIDDDHDGLFYALFRKKPRS
jgi:16S rRNA (cytosine967-C5)-methyltransferase